MITVKPFREEALKAGFKAMQGRLSPEETFETFAQKLAGWRVDAFHDGERAIGMLMTKGAELHVAVVPEVRGKWLSRRLIREVFAPILKDYGVVSTKVLPENKVGIDFATRIRAGFADLTFDPGTALSVGASVLGSAMQADASKSAAGQAAAAANESARLQKEMFDTQNAQQAPYRQAGYNALGEISRGFGIPGAPIGSEAPRRDTYTQTGPNSPNTGKFDQAGYDAAVAAYNASQPVGNDPNRIQSGYFSHQFNADDLKTSLAPNWQFSLEQGQGAAKNALNLTGGLGGNFGKGLVDYTLNKAGDQYQQAFNNYTANQSNIFNRLSTIAGLGSAANTQSANLAGALAPSIGGAVSNAGAAQAAGTVGSANALSGGLGNALGWYQYGKLMNTPQSGSNYNAEGTFQPYYPMSSDSYG